MGAFDQENYEIRSRLPEWWKDDLFLEVINNYSAKIITDILKDFFPYLGVMQPWQLWKTLPEEENWEHNYGHSTDGKITDKWLDGRLKLNYGESFNAYVPNTKRNCNAIINITLHSTDSENKFHNQKIEKLILSNANQTITIRDIDITSTIQINTEEGVVLIDGAEDNSRVLSDGIYYNKVQGSFENIKSEPLNTDQMYDLQPHEENKITKINVQAFTLKNGQEGSCRIEFSIKLLRPVYVVEQNIRVWSPSAFPLKNIKLYGYFCHEHNFNEGWMYLYERGYALEDRVVYDRITREYDCEIFYMTVEYYGIPVPITIGFPQSEYHENPVFETNKALDYWGKIFNLKRRHYNDNISEKDERKTFPKYYLYPIEQDYWYEQRMINEYRDTNSLINGGFLQDTDGNNLAHINIIDPYTKDIYIYSETIPSMQLHNSSLNGNIIYREIFQHENNQRAWLNYTNIDSNDDYSEIQLNAHTTSAISNESYMSDILSLYFQIPEDIPKNIKITGLEVDIEGHNNVYLDNVTLTHNSAIYIPQKYQSNINTLTGSKINGYLSNGSFYENEVINEIERDATYKDLIPPNDNYMYINLDEDIDNRYVWNPIKKKYVKLIINVDGNEWIWSINRKEHVPLAYKKTYEDEREEYYTYNQILDKYQQGLPNNILEKDRIYFIAYNKIIYGYARKEDINYTGDHYTDTDIVYDEFYQVKNESVIDTIITYENEYIPDTTKIYINKLDGLQYIWNNNEYVELYQIRNNTQYTKIDLSENAIWPENNKLLKIGGENNLLNYTDDITKIQLDQGYILPTNNDNEFYARTIRVDLQFENNSEQYNADLKIKNVQLKIWYQIIFENYEVQMEVTPTRKTLKDVKCTRVTDADTIWVEGLDKSIRLGGINAYETNTELGLQGKQFLKNLCENQIVTVDLELSNPGGYGRYTGVVYIKDSNNNMICVNELLLDTPYAVSSQEEWPDRDYPTLDSLRNDKRWRIDIHVSNKSVIPIIYKDLFLILPPEMLYREADTNNLSWKSTAPLFNGEPTEITSFAPLRLSLSEGKDINGNAVTEETNDFYLAYDVILPNGTQGLYDIVLFYDGKEIHKEVTFKYDLNSSQNC